MVTVLGTMTLCSVLGSVIFGMKSMILIAGSASASGVLLGSLLVICALLMYQTRGLYKLSAEVFERGTKHLYQPKPERNDLSLEGFPESSTHQVLEEVSG